MRAVESTTIALALVAGLTNPSPATSGEILRFSGKDAGAATLDPHASGLEDDKVATKQVYEALVDVDSFLDVVPQLAVSWQVMDANRWHFELRPDVTFHDGDPFTASDVTFSIERARAETSDVRSQIATIAAVDAIDDLNVVITTTTPDPSLLLKLAEIAIVSRKWARAHDVVEPANYVKARGKNYATHHANGTGPFRVESFEPRGRYVLVRNPEWWGSAHYPHNFDRIVHVGTDRAENVAGLLEGKLDFLQTPPYAALDGIREAPELKLAHTSKLHTVYFGLDQGSDELRTSDVRGRNPFADRRVREAIALAFDFEPVLRPLMGELYLHAGTIVPPGLNGYVAELGERKLHDPTRARSLLLDAGYPDGFRVTLDCANDWGDDEIATCNGMAEQLGAIGIDVAIAWLSTDEFDAKIYNGRSDFFIDGRHMEPDSVGVLRELFHSAGAFNFSGYANPRIDDLIAKAERELVTYVRDVYLEEAWRTVTNDYVYLPIRHGVSVYALREDLEIPPDPWDVPRFRLGRFQRSKE